MDTTLAHSMLAWEWYQTVLLIVLIGVIVFYWFYKKKMS